MKLAMFATLLLLAACAQQAPTACTEEAKLCPDGSSVGRTGPNCEFAPCPEPSEEPVANGGPVPTSGTRYTFCENDMQLQVAQEQGWTCVTECPTGYDQYASQIGPTCVQHYGAEEISAWETCETGRDCEDGTMCAAAHLTTESENVDEAEYRCAPQDYTDFLLHTSGLTTVDENGDTSTVIA